MPSRNATVKQERSNYAKRLVVLAFVLILCQLMGTLHALAHAVDDAEQLRASCASCHHADRLDDIPFQSVSLGPLVTLSGNLSSQVPRAPAFQFGFELPPATGPPSGSR